MPTGFISKARRALRSSAFARSIAFCSLLPNRLCVSRAEIRRRGQLALAAAAASTIAERARHGCLGLVGGLWPSRARIPSPFTAHAPSERAAPLAYPCGLNAARVATWLLSISGEMEYFSSGGLERSPFFIGREELPAEKKISPREEARGCCPAAFEGVNPPPRLQAPILLARSTLVLRVWHEPQRSITFVLSSGAPPSLSSTM